MSFLRKRWKFLVGVAISVVFLWFSLRGLHLQAVWYYIQIANFWWILPAVAVYFAAVWAGRGVGTTSCGRSSRCR